MVILDKIIIINLTRIIEFWEWRLKVRKWLGDGIGNI
jgi:hypothetical protein